MKKITIKDNLIFASRLFNEASKGKTVTCVCFFEDAIELIKKLMIFGKVKIGGIEIYDYEYKLYDKEYYITLDEDLVLEVHPACQIIDGKADYYILLADEIYIDGGASFNIIQHENLDKCYETEFDDKSELFEKIKSLLDKQELEC